MNAYPIILAHGIARFDFLLARLVQQFGALSPFLEAATDGVHYFKGIARHLRHNDFDVYSASVSFAAALPRRAGNLRDEVQRALALKGARKVHIIAHSMGGLDARYMIARLDMAEQVASLTTIGTPHLGTSFADWGIAHQGDQLIRDLKSVVDLDGFLALTTANCRAFNDEAASAEAANSVFYQTYAAAEPRAHVFAPLRSSWDIIAQAEGDNDGLVPRSSQRWTNELSRAGGERKAVAQHDFPVPADHLNEIGWCDLDEFALTAMPLFELAARMTAYEASVRNVYLKIARDVSAL